MKKFLAVLLILCMMLSFAACGKQEFAAESSGKVMITSDLALEDPDIEYAHRYVYMMDDTTPAKENFEYTWSIAGVDLTYYKSFFIIYSDEEDKPVYGLEYYIFTSPEEVEKFNQTYKAWNADDKGNVTGLINVGNVAITVMDYDSVNRELDSLVEAGLLKNNKKEKTASGMIRVLSEALGMYPYEG